MADLLLVHYKQTRPRNRRIQCLILSLCWIGLLCLTRNLTGTQGQQLRNHTDECNDSIQIASVSFQEFLTACQEGNVTLVACAVKHSLVEINQKTHRGWTGLHVASNLGHTEVVKQLLLHRNIDVNIRTDYGSLEEPKGECGTENRGGGQTALQLAAESHHSQVFGLLIQAGADVYNSDTDGTTILHAVLSTNHSRNSELLLRMGNKAVHKLINVKDRFGKLPTTSIIWHDDIESFRTLHLEFGVGFQGNSFLSEAIREHRLNIALESIKFRIGTDDSILRVLLYSWRNAVKPCPVNVSLCSDEQKNMRNFIRQVFFALHRVPRINFCGDPKERYYFPPIAQAIEQNVPEVIDVLVGEGCKVAKSLPDWLLSHACKMGNLVAVRFLVENAGIDVNSPGVNRRTPIYDAISSNSLEIVRFLLQSGASIDFLDDKNLTPLEFALSEDKLDIGQVIQQSSFKSLSVITRL
jgi:ankyrin repeat protein